MLDLGVIVSNFKFLVVQVLFGLGGFAGGTLRLAIPAIVLGFLLGIFVGIARLARARWINLPATVYVEFFRGVPLVMVIFWIWFVVPQLLRLPIPEYGVALTAFVIFEAAYFGEIVRAGIQSVPRGQVSAGYALGLNYWQMMGYVVLPQAFRNMTPVLLTQTVILFQDTSLVYVLSVTDFLGAAAKVANRDHRLVEMYLFAAVVYFLVSFGASYYVRRMQARIAIPT